MARNSGTPIQRQVVLHICADIRAECRGQWWTAAGMRCALCRFFAWGELSNMYWALEAGNRGCWKINQRFDRLGMSFEPAGFDE